MPDAHKYPVMMQWPKIPSNAPRRASEAINPSRGNPFHGVLPETPRRPSGRPDDSTVELPTPELSRSFERLYRVSRNAFLLG